jgi:hypothetical protein
MRSRASIRRGNGLAVAGALLVVAGVGSLVARDLRLDPFAPITDAGWPFFVIIPGVILMLSSLIPKPPGGVGFGIAGSIVTTVGLVLLYQEQTAHWESWAYAWALVGPGAAGLGMLVYGLVFDQRDLVSAGLRLATIAAAIFIAGYWFFETVFATGRAPVDLGAWWPVVVIVAGLAALTIGLTRSGGGHQGADDRSPAADGHGAKTK